MRLSIIYKHPHPPPQTPTQPTCAHPLLPSQSAHHPPSASHHQPPDPPWRMPGSNRHSWGGGGDPHRASEKHPRHQRLWGWEGDAGHHKNTYGKRASDGGRRWSSSSSGGGSGSSGGRGSPTRHSSADGGSVLRHHNSQELHKYTHKRSHSSTSTGSLPSSPRPVGRTSWIEAPSRPAAAASAEPPLYLGRFRRSRRVSVGRRRPRHRRCSLRR